ncbi:hypothetical protein RV13_GL004017 [Enterococcus raffinosus]|nr:hypothetical protein RV13_GL004017 [Enterococcus raffinosus]
MRSEKKLIFLFFRKMNTKLELAMSSAFRSYTKEKLLSA